MAQFEIGDKVKFLNSVGGGIVKKIQGGQVFVEDESGFDMPFAPNELIRMAEQQGVGKVFNDETIGQSAEEKAKQEHREPTQLELIEEADRGEPPSPQPERQPAGPDKAAQEPDTEPAEDHRKNIVSIQVGTNCTPVEKILMYDTEIRNHSL